MFRKLKEYMSIQLSKNPGRVILVAILLLNVVFIAVAACILKGLSLVGTQEMSFGQAVFHTIKMIMDAGCIESVEEQIGGGGVALAITCVVIVIIGMVLFTGAVIGYLTNYISSFISDANVGAHKLHLSRHTVILNWNSRASEIVNDLLYRGESEKVVILVAEGKESIEKELAERIADTVAQENEAIRERAAKLPKGKRRAYIRKNKFKNKLVVIVREGDTFSTKQLRDISLERAKSIIILGSDVNNTVCKYNHQSLLADRERGNPLSIKALVQVAEITGAATSDDDQKIVVEVEDEWTLELVQKIIRGKQVDGKCKIIPVSVNQILGRLLSQFALMPELNLAYKELFSNKGMSFYSVPCETKDEHAFTQEYLRTHAHAIPLTVMEDGGKLYGFYAAKRENDHEKTTKMETTEYRVKLNYQYQLEQKNVIILGHNSKIGDIMEGFDNFRGEWNQGNREILNIIVIDDKNNLEKMDYYRKYPYVTKTVEADIYDKEIICKTIEEFVDANEGDTSVLILSDDTVLNEQIDSGAIANLIYVRDIILRKKNQNPDFYEGKIDVVVEILNPKHYDIVKSYSVNNVVISNRYVSKMVTQLGYNDTLYNFYDDILKYDEDGAAELESKEIYIKKVEQYFAELPGPSTTAELIRAVVDAAPDEVLTGGVPNHTILLGYLKAETGEMVMFTGDQTKQKVELSAQDKLIVFSSH